MHLRLVRLIVGLGLGSMLCHLDTLRSEEREFKIPAHLSKYDLATPDDLVFSYMLAPLFESSDASQWSILRDLRSQVGGWVDDVLASNKIAGTISSAMPIEGQPPLQQLDHIVADCAKILHLDGKPTVYVRNSEEQRVHSFSSSTGSFLVITSGLLRLHDKKPEEVRFLVGRELGHLKANHSQMRRAGFAILSLIRTVDASAIPDKFQNALPTLAMGRFLSWLRESELRADRAGLLCCQDVKVAYAAMTRQLHGLPDGNIFLDPSHPDFDEKQIIRNFQQWQSQPLVRFIIYAKRSSADAPFIPDRLAALKAWSKTDRYQELLNRSNSRLAPKILTLESIVLKNISPKGSKVYPYVIAKEESGAKWFQTKTGPFGPDVAWEDINSTTGTSTGRPIFFEVWEDRMGTDRMIGGFYILPADNQAEYVVHVSKDWSERVTDISPSFARVKVRIEEKVSNVH
jgi:Zn-dependent protease with chaperone function